MKTYYEQNADGTVGRFTTSEKRARVCGLTLETERKVVMGCDGKLYFKGEEPENPTASGEGNGGAE